MLGRLGIMGNIIRPYSLLYGLKKNHLWVDINEYDPHEVLVTEFIISFSVI